LRQLRLLRTFFALDECVTSDFKLTSRVLRCQLAAAERKSRYRALDLARFLETPVVILIVVDGSQRLKNEKGTTQ